MSKKMLPIYVIETLQKYSDENHKLYIQEIIDYIQINYNESFERNSVSRCIQ